MPFYATSFQFDGIPSETYGLVMNQVDSSAVTDSMGSSSMDIMNQKIYRRPTPYFYGATPSPILSFEISANALEEIDTETFQLIQKWLFSPRFYKKLLIFQPDMQDVYFNCIFNDPKIKRIGNKITGFTATVECDSPFAYQFPKTTTYSYTSPVVDNTVTFNNASDDSGNYLYPKNIITINSFGGSMTITNLNDNNRVFMFSSLLANEIITIDNSLQTISSSTGLKRLSLFNKHFLRLVPGVNRLRIQGVVSSVAMTTQFLAKKIGG